MIGEDILKALLDRIRTDGIAPIGVEDYIEAHTLLVALPHLGEPGRRAELRSSLASLLATDQDQWEKVRHLAEQFLPDPPPEEETKTILELIPEPRRELIRARFSGIWRKFLDLPRWIFVAVGALPLILAIAIGVWLASQPKPLSGRTDDPIAAQEPPRTSNRLEKEPDRPEARGSFTMTARDRNYDGHDFGMLALGVLLVALGGSWLLMMLRLPERRRKEAADLSDKGHALRAEQSRIAEENGVSRRLVYHVSPTPPMREEGAADSATILGRLFGELASERLDIDGTVGATIDAGGRFVPVRGQRSVSRTLTILVDVEKGAHPWLDDINWLLGRWSALGVAFERYDFRFDPFFLTHARSGLPSTIQALGRRFENEPLLVIARNLTTRDFRSEAAWLRHTQVWPVKAWLDPTPLTSDELPRQYRLEVERLHRRGFHRFAFSEKSLISLADYLCSEGLGARPVALPPLPSLGEPGMVEAIERWALFAALVPDPTWAQLQYVRETVPELRQRFPDNRSLQRLLEWAEANNPRHGAESGDGRTLRIEAVKIEELVSKFRRAEAGLPPEQRLEERCRQILLSQLGATAPDDPLMRQFWELKHVQHLLVLDPDAAVAKLGDLLGGAWHDAALAAARTELERDTHERRLPRSLRDALRITVDEGGALVRAQDLIRPDRVPALVSTALAAVLAASFWQSNIQEKLLTARYDFSGLLPADWRLVQTPEAETPTSPGTASAVVRPGVLPKPKLVVRSIAERVRNIVASHLGVDARKVTDSASFIRDLNADSLDSVELVMAFEEEFKIAIADDACAKLATVGDVVRYIQDHPPTDNEAIAARILALPVPKSRDIDYKIAEIIVGAYDQNFTKNIDTVNELSRIDCRVWKAVETKFMQSGWMNIYHIAGFAPGWGWAGGALGFSEKIRGAAGEAMVACGLKATGPEDNQDRSEPESPTGSSPPPERSGTPDASSSPTTAASAPRS